MNFVGNYELHFLVNYCCVCLAGHDNNRSPTFYPFDCLSALLSIGILNNIHDHLSTLPLCYGGQSYFIFIHVLVYLKHPSDQASESKQCFITNEAHSPLCSPFHCPVMTEILFKRTLSPKPLIHLYLCTFSSSGCHG